MRISFNHVFEASFLRKFMEFFELNFIKGIRKIVYVNKLLCYKFFSKTTSFHYRKIPFRNKRFKKKIRSFQKLTLMNNLEKVSSLKREKWTLIEKIRRSYYQLRLNSMNNWIIEYKQIMISERKRLSKHNCN